MGARRPSRIGGPPNLLRKSVPPPPAYAAASRSLTADAGAHAVKLPSLNEKENQMHIELFRALKGANVSDDAAAEVVEAVEEYIAVKVQEANKGLEAQLKAQTWVIGSVGFVIAVIGLAPAVFKLFQH
jgi:hypothetical protein